MFQISIFITVKQTPNKLRELCINLLMEFRYNLKLCLTWNTELARAVDIVIARAKIIFWLSK